MVKGWRRAFGKSMPKQTQPNALLQQQQQKPPQWDCATTTINQSPNLNLTAFYSNPSTPQSHSHSHSQSPILHCRTTCSLPNSPVLQCNNNANNNKHSSVSTPSSPNSHSPSPLSLLKSTLRLSLSKELRCGICTQSVKAGQGTAIFTAECAHTFHFPCIAAHVRKRQLLTCPVCSTNWKQLTADENTPPPSNNNNNNNKTTRSFKLYNDDEPLASPTSVSGFNPIPESEEENEENEEESANLRGFHVSPSSPLKTRNTVEACFLPDAAVVASNRSYETYVAVLKVTAPPCDVSAASRPPVDLVAMLDVGGIASGEELRALKRSMRVMISSLGSTDRLSVVAFSGGSKRLFPLRRMTGKGQRAARRILDALAAVERSRGGATSRNDALKKAAKVLEDRREKNPVGKIVLLSNDRGDQRLSSTRFYHLESPVRDGMCGEESAFAKRVGDLFNIAAQDLTLELRVASSRSAPAEIAAVYSLSAAVLSPDSAAIGDLHAAEERELLVEFKVPAGTLARGTYRHVISVRSSYREPFTQELVSSKERLIIVPRPRAVGSSDRKIQRLRNLHVSTRAVAESRRLSAHNDLAGALHLLSSAQALLMQPSREADCSDEYLKWLETEQAELRRRARSQKLRANNCLEEKLEPFTPTSAWRAAEKLAKVAMMRKSLNKVSDLHGFENARF